MKSLVYIAFIGCLIPVFSFASNLTNISGKIYYDVTEGVNTANYVTIRHSKGITRVAYTDMSYADKVKYGWRKPLEAASNSDANELKNDSKEIPKEAVRNGDADAGKLIMMVGDVAYDFSKFNPKLPNHRMYQYFIDGKVVQVLDDGLLIDCKYTTTCSFLGLVFVKDYPEQGNVVDGNWISPMGMMDGRYQYVSVDGAKHTVALFRCARKPSKPIAVSEVHRLPKMTE